MASKLFQELPSKDQGAYHIFKAFGETVMTSLLVCNYMKTFDNAETDTFMKRIKDFCKFDRIYCVCDERSSYGSSRCNFDTGIFNIMRKNCNQLMC